MKAGGWILAGLLAAGTAWAAEPEEPPKVVKASELMGMKVKDRQQRELGEITDVALDLENNALVYVVLSASGDVQSVAIAADELEPAPDGQGFVTAIPREALAGVEALEAQGGPDEATSATAAPASPRHEEFGAFEQQPQR